MKEAVFSMDKLKAPGIDGFNAFFFQSAWSEIGDSVTKAVQYFFDHCHMPNQVNCTLMTLNPKVDNAIHVKDFRPIACCSVLYKKISKVLANSNMFSLISLVKVSRLLSREGLFLTISSLVMS